MEFLRFGSSIPGSYWGCCAVCIIQNFKVDPDAPASIEIVSGDGGTSFEKYVGKTWREIFWQRIRFGTFSTSNMANHAFIATLTASQISGNVGKKWLEILHEAGFEFIRAVSNSVYQGSHISESPSSGLSNGSLNYIFMLVRNIADGSPTNAFRPPEAWLNLQKAKGQKARHNLETWDIIEKTGFDIKSFYVDQRKDQTAAWKALPEPKWYTEAELKKAGVPVWKAGLRSPYPQQLLQHREAAKAENQPKKGKKNGEEAAQAAFG